MRHLRLLLLAAAVAGHATAAAQATGRVATAARRVDSISAATVVRRAQRDFEHERFAHLPRTGGDRGSCEVRIGRWCMQLGPLTGPLPEEPGRVGAARMLLLNTLDEGAVRLPGDDWIAGQRVRYLIENGWGDSAVVAAHGCRGTPWWCAALDGLARHAANDFGGSDTAFARAIAGMPAGERCAWTDLQPLLREREARRYGELSCEERSALNDRIWWLARPLYSIAGNDLRTEHYARHVMARLIRESSSPYGAWGDDLKLILLRFGWAVSWERPFGRAGYPDEVAIRGYERRPWFWFFAEHSIAPDTLDGETWQEPSWDPSAERPPSLYAPVWASAFGEIRRAQVARFRRDGGFFTIGAFDLRGDTLFTGNEPRVALAVTRDPRTPPVVGPALFPRSTGIIAVTSPWAPTIVSIEAREDVELRAARLRAFADRPARWLSDLLLFIPGEELPDSLGVALPLAVRGIEVPPGRRVGLFWETYGEPGADSLDVEVKVVRASRRDTVHPALGRAECAPEGKAPVAVRWRDAAAPAGPRARAVTLDVSALDPGRYVVAVAMSAADSSACASRDLEITRP